MELYKKIPVNRQPLIVDYYVLYIKYRNINLGVFRSTVC
jgi:hypothetical protein